MGERSPIEITPDGAELLERALVVYRAKHGARAADVAPRDVVVECIATYLELYEPRYGEPDALSRRVVYGAWAPRPSVRDLDEVARLVVNGGACIRCGKCCRRTIGVTVSAQEIEAIEKLGYAREDFLDRDGMVKATPQGCYFLMHGPNGRSSCAIYPARPQICRDHYCAAARRRGSRRRMATRRR